MVYFVRISEMSKIVVDTNVFLVDLNDTTRKILTIHLNKRKENCSCKV